MNRTKLLSLLLLGLLTGIFANKATAQQDNQWTLQECINYALEHNIDVKQQKLQTRISAAELKSSKADLLPNLSAFSNFSYTSGRSVDPFTNEISNTDRKSSDMGFSSDLMLFQGMQRKNTIDRNEYQLKSNMESLELIKDNISMDVARSYMQILFNKELLTAARNQLDITKQQADRTEKLVSAGKLARSDLLEIEAQQAQEKLQVVERRNALNNSILELTQLLELDSVGNFSVAAPDITIEEEDQALPAINNVYREALQIMHNIKSAEYDVKAAEKQYKVAKGNYSPRLSLRANYYTGYSNTRDLYDSTGIVTQPIGIVEETGRQVVAQRMNYEVKTYPFMDQLSDNAQTAVSLRLSIPIFSQLNNKTAATRAKIQKLQSENELEKQENQLRKQIQTAHSDAIAALEKFLATQKSVEANREAFQFAEQRFNLGLINSVDYNTAKNNLTSAQSELVKSKYDFLFKRTILNFYRGKQLKID